ncbi:MAG: response regulator [Actinomycetota bacterium]|nr:response regulator [Actinomycetota bacterium]
MVRGQATATASSIRRVLVIDDEQRIRSFTARALSSAGFAVTEAATGPEGLTAALSDHPDLVLLDLALPGLSGEDVLRRLQQERPRQAVLVWSATADRTAERRCLALGARAYLHKPVSIKELLSCIDTAGSDPSF